MDKNFKIPDYATWKQVFSLFYWSLFNKNKLNKFMEMLNQDAHWHYAFKKAKNLKNK